MSADDPAPKSGTSEIVNGVLFCRCPSACQGHPDLGPWCCYAGEVGAPTGECSPENPIHDPAWCGYDNVRRGLVPAPAGLRTLTPDGMSAFTDATPLPSSVSPNRDERASDQWVCFDPGDLCSEHAPHPGCRYVDRYPTAVYGVLDAHVDQLEQALAASERREAGLQSYVTSLEIDLGVSR